MIYDGEVVLDEKKICFFVLFLVGEQDLVRLSFYFPHYSFVFNKLLLRWNDVLPRFYLVEISAGYEPCAGKKSTRSLTSAGPELLVSVNDN